jgi:hypothetical protein
LSSRRDSAAAYCCTELVPLELDEAGVAVDEVDDAGVVDAVVVAAGVEGVAAAAAEVVVVFDFEELPQPAAAIASSATQAIAVVGRRNCVGIVIGESSPRLDLSTKGRYFLAEGPLVRTLQEHAPSSPRRRRGARVATDIRSRQDDARGRVRYAGRVR